MLKLVFFWTLCSVDLHRGLAADNLLLHPQPTHPVYFQDCQKCHSFYLDNSVNGCGQVADFWSLSEEYGVTADFLFQSGRVEVVLAPAPGRVQWHKCRQCMCQIAVTLCWGSRCFLFILLLTQNSDICEFSGFFGVFSNSIVLHYAGKFKLNSDRMWCWVLMKCNILL